MAKAKLNDNKYLQEQKEKIMSLYMRGNYWWVSIWKNGRHIQVSTKLTEKKRARAVEQALRLTGSAENGVGERVTVGTGNDGSVAKEIVLGLLRAVYGDGREVTRLDGVWMEYLDVLKVKGKVVTPKNLRDKKSCFDKFITWAGEEKIEYLGQVDGAAAKAYAVHLAKEGASGKRRKNIILHLSAVWNAIGPSHKDVVNPWPVVSPSNVEAEVRAVFTKKEEDAVLKACQEVHPQWYVASMIARHTGLRYGDVCRLTYGEINMKDKIIRVIPQKTKNSSGVGVVVPISHQLEKVLEDWMEKNPRRTKHDRVLPWLREYGPKDDRRFSTVLAKVGLDPKKYSFHTWRHQFRSALAETGASTDVAMKLCGHTTKEMSERYNHADLLPGTREAVERAASV